MALPFLRRDSLSQSSVRHTQETGVSVAHSRIPGRIRFRIPTLRRAPHLAHRLERLVAGLSKVRDASANPLTGALLVRYTQPMEIRELHRRIGQLLEELTGSGTPATESKGTHIACPANPQPLGSHEQGLPPEPDRDWHWLTIQESSRALGTSRTRGLPRTAAETRLQAYGLNRLTEERMRTPFELLLGQVANLPVILLGISAGVSLITGGFVDAIAIVGVVAINTAIGYLTERQSERTIYGLNHRAVPLQTTVIRSGHQRTISPDEVVPGDMVILRAGSRIPADIRLVQTHRLSVDQSSLTGESLPVTKRADSRVGPDTPLADRSNMAFMGTHVTGGTAQGLVVATGTTTEIGQVQAMLGQATAPDTPMERQLSDLGRTLALISSAVCAGVFVLGLAQGQDPLFMLKGAISLAVAAVPEGLPTVATTTLALGIRDMQRRQVAIRQLGAVETLGAIQVLCLDKTGTLTLNRMSVVAANAGGEPFAVQKGRFHNGSAGAIEPGDHPVLAPLLETVALCTEVEVQPTVESEQRFTGSATEIALLEAAQDAGLDLNSLWREQPILRTHLRSEGRPYMTTLHELPTGGCLLAVKGSPTEVLERCTRVHQGEDSRALTVTDRRAIQGVNEDLAGDGLRVLGVARRHVSEGVDPDTQELEWLGLVALADPVRNGMAEVIRQFHRAGIETVMITGDQSATAYAVGQQLRLSGDRPLEVLDSSHLEKMDSQVLAGVVRRVHIFSRVSPAHKLRIVQAFQKAGRVVAMTGDGINDGPALKAADIGVAMGASGTEVARSVANVILENDNLETMVVAIQRGRSTYSNIRKTIRFLLATNFSEIQVMALSTGLGLGQVLHPMQLLWINLITDIFPGLALSLGPPEPDLLDRPPRDPLAPIISGRDLERISLESATISAGSLGAYAMARWLYGPGPEAGTHLFTSLTLAQLAHTLSTRSEQRTLFRSQPANPYLYGALAGSFGAQVLAGALPSVRALLGTAPLQGRDYLTITAGASLPLLLNEATKGWPAGAMSPAPGATPGERGK